MNLEEFERGYAERSGLTVEELHDYGLRGAPCACGESGCQGWQMLHNAKRGGQTGGNQGAVWLIVEAKKR